MALIRAHGPWRLPRCPARLSSPTRRTPNLAALLEAVVQRVLLTDKKLPGDPTPSYRTRTSVRIVGELVDWVGHTPAQVQGMKEGLEQLRLRGDAVIYD